MIETYAFYTAFAVQILAMSVLFPAWLIRYCRVWPTVYPDSFAKMYPGMDHGVALERYALSTRRFTALFLGANAVIAIFGAWVLAWLFRRMQLPDWDHKYVVIQTLKYFMLQGLPLLLVALYGGWYMLKHKPATSEPKRRATLQRRGLFDFVPPSVVGFSVLAYFLFVGFVIYLWRQQLSGADALVWIGIITFVYALDAFSIYRKLYGRKNRLEPQEGRVERIGMGVKVTVYINLTVVMLFSVLLAITQLDLQKWAPFALSAFFSAITFLMSAAVTKPRRHETDGLASSEVPS